MCHAHVSHKWLFHFDACGGSVLTSHGYITTCTNDMATETGRALASAVCVDHSWTTSLSTEKPAAPLKPLRDTMHAFTPSQEDKDSQTRYHHGTLRTQRSTIQTGRSFYYHCCPRTQRGSGWVCGLLQRNSGPRRRSTSSF